jgi:hypothetical protein
MLTMENWASLKREATTLEQYVEKRLHSREPPAAPVAAALAGDAELGAAAANPQLVRLREIDESLGRLSGVVERLSVVATSSGNAANQAVANVGSPDAAENRGTHPAPSAAPPCTPTPPHTHTHTPPPTHPPTALP